MLELFHFHFSKTLFLGYLVLHYVSQNLEIKKINEEKKAALAAQFAAEATLRRVHTAQKDDEMPPVEAIITPLEAELKLARMEVYFGGYVLPEAWSFCYAYVVILSRSCILRGANLPVKILNMHGIGFWLG